LQSLTDSPSSSVAQPVKPAEDEWKSTKRALLPEAYLPSKSPDSSSDAEQRCDQATGGDTPQSQSTRSPPAIVISPEHQRPTSDGSRSPLPLHEESELLPHESDSQSSMGTFTKNPECDNFTEKLVAGANQVQSTNSQTEVDNLVKTATSDSPDEKATEEMVTEDNIQSIGNQTLVSTLVMSTESGSLDKKSDEEQMTEKKDAQSNNNQTSADASVMTAESKSTEEQMTEEEGTKSSDSKSAEEQMAEEEDTKSNDSKSAEEQMAKEEGTKSNDSKSAEEQMAEEEGTKSYDSKSIEEEMVEEKDAQSNNNQASVDTLVRSSETLSQTDQSSEEKKVEERCLQSPGGGGGCPALPQLCDLKPLDSSVPPEIPVSVSHEQQSSNSIVSEEITMPTKDQPELCEGAKVSSEASDPSQDEKESPSFPAENAVV